MQELNTITLDRIEEKLDQLINAIAIVKNSTKKFSCNGKLPITVFYTDDTEGGGQHFGQDFISKIKIKYPNRKFSKVFEWCSGPGFIGFSLLSHGICDKLCLTDLHNPALELLDQTINYQENNCSDLVSTYLLKDMGLLPAHEMFDLVVSNPPHYNKNVSQLENANRICSDINWQSHKNFFNNIKSHLMPNGIILLQENYKGSTPDSFKSFIDNSGLQITDCFNSVESKYFLEIKLK